MQISSQYSSPEKKANTSTNRRCHPLEIMIKHPLQGAEKQVWLWYLLGINFAPLAGVLYFIPLEPDIVAFEFDPIKTLSAWNFTEKLWAAFSLGLDFLFLIIYSTLLSLGCIRFASSFQSKLWAKLGTFLAWGQWAAASFDVLEDISLVVILFGSQINFIMLISRFSAFMKFTLILSGLLYIIMGILKSLSTISKKW
jgi:hypothetical protein